MRLLQEFQQAFLLQSELTEDSHQKYKFNPTIRTEWVEVYIFDSVHV